MRKILNPKAESWDEIIKRPSVNYENLLALVSEVFDEIQKVGDKAIFDYTKRFDQIQIENLNVTENEISQANKSVPKKLKKAIKQAKKNIEIFHKSQKTKTIKVETTKGVVCWQKKYGIDKVGLYIPGGSAPLFSSILMLAIPARIAGCKEIIICSPPNKKGSLPAEILYTAKLCGISKIFKVGGIQAIAGMTFGTQKIPKVFKIFGPGNQYVTAAKQLATKFNVAIDLPAGPSELLIAADETADPDFIASDLLSQAEHGSDSQVILVTTKESIIEKVNKSIAKQLENLTRKKIAEKALANSKMIVFKNDETATSFINDYSPEHYIICVKNESYYLNRVRNAGSVFIGNYTPESAGDYASGTNHTLPTNGFAKQFSGVNLDSFCKTITFQKISKTGIKNLGESVELMAEAEGLIAHKNAISVRLKKIRDEN
tara:strand:- start:312 stop:1604 length:1293 start_codon:yes stop_codon:yes gene_type:complete